MPNAELRESSALTCDVGPHKIAIPRSQVGQILDFDVAPSPPFSNAAVAGMGVLDDDVIVLLSAVPAPERARMESRTTKAVMIVGERAGLRWAVEVDGTRGFESVWVDEDPDDPGPDLPWTIPGLLEDGTTAIAIDLDRLIGDIVGDVRSNSKGGRA